MTKKAGGVVVLGNCVGEGIVAGLSSSSRATKQFDFHAIPLHLKQVTDNDVQQILAGASIVLVQGVVRSILPDIEKVKRPHCEVWMYPDAVLRSPWPFDGMAGGRDPAVVTRLGQRGLTEHHLHDLALAELRTLEPNPQRRLERYRALDFPLASSQERIISAQDSFLKMIDGETDLGLGAFIRGNYQQRQLFYNSTHPSSLLFQHVCEHYWEKLELEGSPPKFGNIDHWRASCVPVHPSLASALGLKWAPENRRYYCGDWGQLTWDEWVRRYIRDYG